MQTAFSETQLEDPETKEIDGILRTCVHCGFCTATCPTYVTLGDELDSPRGRIYLMKRMFETGSDATPEVVRHLDRCLSCLACMTTCPSGVHYMHLIDSGRAHIEKTYRRPFVDRWLRRVLATVLPSPTLFRAALAGAWFGRPVARLVPGRIGALFRLAPAVIPPPSVVERPGVHPAEGVRRGRVALLMGCAQPVLAPSINEAAIRLMTRHGLEVVVARDVGCCGSLTHHMGRTDDSHAQAKRAIDGWWAETREGGGEGLDAIVITASGCGTTIKDYGHMFRLDPDYREKAATISLLARDVTEIMHETGLASPVVATGHRLAYHSACSMQHGQKLTTQPKALLKQAGFDVVDVPEGHLCCGSAGTYNILQPAIAERLGRRKIDNIEKTRPELIATGNIGCMTQIGLGTDIPILHTVELLDWVTGGPRPAGIADLPSARPKPERAVLSLAP